MSTDVKANALPKSAVKKATVKKAEKKEKPVVLPTFESIYNAMTARAYKAKFTSEFISTQITLTGSLEFRPLYVKVEDKVAEVAPYEYNNASFYIDADTDVFAAVLSGKKSFYEALTEGSIGLNGDPKKAVLFAKAMF